GHGRGRQFTNSPVFRRDAADACRKRGVRAGIDRTMPDGAARGELAEVIVALPARRRTDRTRLEATAAIRAHIAEHVADTGGAKRAFEAADACFERRRRQGPVAMF